MKTNTRLSLVAGTALALLTPHLWALPAHAGVAVRIGQNFAGSSSSTAYAPNPSGGASADYFAEFNTDQLAVYSKAKGSLVQSIAVQDFWSQAGVTVPSTFFLNTPWSMIQPFNDGSQRKRRATPITVPRRIISCWRFRPPLIPRALGAECPWPAIPAATTMPVG